MTIYSLCFVAHDCVHIINLTQLGKMELIMFRRKRSVSHAKQDAGTSHSENSSAPSLQKRKSDSVFAEHLITARFISMYLMRLPLLNQSQEQINIESLANISAYMERLDILIEGDNATLNFLRSESKRLDNEHIALNRQLDAIHFDTPFRITIDKESHLYGNKENHHDGYGNDSSVLSCEKDHVVTHDNVEEKVLEMWHEIRLWANDHKPDSFAVLVERLAEKETLAIQRKLHVIGIIAPAHPLYAAFASQSGTLAQKSLELLEFSRVKTPKELATTSFKDFSVMLDSLNADLAELKRQYEKFKATKNLLILKHQSVSDLKEKMESIRLELDSSQSPSSNATHKEVWELMQNSHRILSTVIDIADMMYSDIIDQPRYNVDGALKIIEPKLEVLNQKMLLIKAAREKARANIAAKKQHGFLAPASNSITTSNTELPKQRVQHG